jgi:hypothetical protein
MSTAACVSVRDSESLTLDADGVWAASARVDNGSVQIDGVPSRDHFDVTATTWGSGSNRDAAAARELTVTWSAVVEGHELLVDGITTESRSGVDFDIVGPTLLDLDLGVDDGNVEVNDVEGLHVVTADRISGLFVGDVDLFARSSLDIGFVPFLETDTLIESQGSVVLAVPFGLEYDLTVRGDPDDEMVITELGWDDAVFGEGFFNGRRGRGDIEIDVIAQGSVEILELR